MKTTEHFAEKVLTMNEVRQVHTLELSLLDAHLLQPFISIQLHSFNLLSEMSFKNH